MADNNMNTTRTTEQQRVKEITDKLEEGLKELFESEKYKSYLNTMSKFHNYSFNNTLLIAMQKPDATLVAGYKAWQKNFDRHVNKGEKAIRILAPAPYKIKEERDKLDPVTGELLFDENGMPQKENVEITIPAFRAVSVFDVSQTDGKPIPELETAELLQTVEGYEDFVKALMEVAPVPIGFEDIPGESKGYFHTEERRIAVQENMSESQTLKTMVHEVAHSMLHNKELNKDIDAPVKDRNTKEVEAESIAYTVCQHFGIDTSDYSFGYIAGWSSGKEMTELKASLDTIRKTASELITGIEGQLQALQLNRAMEQAEEKECLLLVQTMDLSEYSLLNVRGMDAQELVATLADMNDNDKLSVQAYLESKGAWTTEIANQDTKEFEEYHLDVRYFTDRDEIVDVSKGREKQAEENLSIMGRAEALIGDLEADKTLFTSEERNLIVNYAYKTDDFDKTKALAEKLALMEDKGLAGAGKVMAEAQAEIDELPDPMIGLYEMHDYGYNWSEMLLLTKDRALELWDDDFPIYLLHVDGSETMADDREAVLAQIRGSKEAEVQDTSRQDVPKQKPEVENDIAIDLVGTKSIDLDVLQYVPDISNESKAMEVVAELIAKLPDREIDGNLSPELETKVWEKRMPQLSEEEKLAVEFDRLWFDYDTILYNDSVRSMTENVEELVQEIKTDGTERISDILREIVAEGAVPEEVDRAKKLLEKLSEYKPLAKVEEMEEQNYNMMFTVEESNLISIFASESRT